MPYMERTADVSHEEMSLLKEEAPKNMYLMERTADVTHDPMSGLHVLLPVGEPPPPYSSHHWLAALNRHFMSVMRLTSQSAMLPCAARAAASLLHHRSTASCRSGLLSKVVCADALVGGSNAPKTARMSFIVSYSQRTQLEAQHQEPPRPPRPRCFGSARAQAAAGASVSSIKWDEHGAGLFWGSRGRSRHEGDPRPRAQQRSDRQSDCASILGASRSRGGGRSTACSRARARCSGGCGAR
mmetsp:Transcript_14963/g.49643  ORF Transcript_14963/g.49643 Transcript_14963/m.49643 type:complete len:241 (-) Transcript_14963:129-851(-)